MENKVLHSVSKCCRMVILAECIAIFAGIILLNTHSFALNDDSPESQSSNCLVKEKQKEMESVLAELCRLAKETKDAEEGANSHRNSAEEALADYQKLKANELLNVNNYSMNSALKTRSTLEDILAEVEKVDDYDRKVFELKSRTHQLKKKLIKTENELANAQIQYIAEQSTKTR